MFKLEFLVAQKNALF